MDSLQYSFLIVFIQFLGIFHEALAISCFTCSSRNGSDITCEDPFQPGPFSYTEKCKVPKRGHKDGLFPAHFCIKLIAVTASTREKLVVRRCVMQNMENQCGKFKLENETLHGCLLTCDMDGCNPASPSVTSNNILMVMLATVATVCTFILQKIHNDDHLLFSHHHQQQQQQLSPRQKSSLYNHQRESEGDKIGQDRIFSPNFLHNACRHQISQLLLIGSNFFNNNLRTNLSKDNMMIRHSTNFGVRHESHSCTDNCNVNPLLIA